MFVVYHKDSTLFLSRLTRGVNSSHWATAGAAKAALTRACKADHNLAREDFLIEDSWVFHNKIEKQHTVFSLMTGSPVQEGVNTPHHCSVASESYWSA